MKEHKNRSYSLDLHGHPVHRAVKIANDVVRDAWKSGYQSVEIIHGAPDVKDRSEAVEASLNASCGSSLKAVLEAISCRERIRHLDP